MKKTYKAISRMLFGSLFCGVVAVWAFGAHLPWLFPAGFASLALLCFATSLWGGGTTEE